MAWLKRFNAVVTVEPMTFLYYFAFGMGIVVWQQTIYIKLCVQEGYNISRCSDERWATGHPALQQKASYWTLYTNIAVLPPLLFCLTILSGYSDRNGLRLPLALPLIGNVFITLWTILQVVYLDWDPALLLISAVVWGITGYFPTINMAGTTYLIRDPDVQNLGLRIAVLEGTQVLATAVGTILAGPILDATSPGRGLINAWVVCSALQVLALLDVFLRLKQLPAPRHATSDIHYGRCATIKKLFNLDSFKSYFMTVFRKRAKSKRLHFHIVVMSTLVMFLSLAGVTDIVFLYLTKQYGKTNTDYSIYQGLNCISSLIGNTVFVHIFTTRYRMSDIGFTVLGAISTTISYTLLGYANHLAPYWLAVVFRLFASYPSVGGRLYISHTMEDGEQAAGMGYYATVQCVTTLLASLIFNSLYPETLHFWPGLCFALCALLVVLTVPALTFVKWNDRKHGTYH